jgi:hypothetical protein
MIQPEPARSKSRTPGFRPRIILKSQKKSVPF